MDNIFSKYNQEDQVLTVEVSDVNVCDAIIGQYDSAAAVLTIESALNDMDMIASAEDAMEKYEVAIAPIVTAQKEGTLTTENAATAVASLNTLVADLNLGAKELNSLEVETLTVENATSHPEPSVELTIEGANKILAGAKDMIVKLVKQAIDSLKKVGVKLVAGAMGTEKQAADLKVYLTDKTGSELKEGAAVEPEKITSLVGAVKYSKAGLESLLTLGADSGRISTIVGGLDKAAKAGDMKDFYSSIAKGSLDVSALFENGKESTVVSSYAIDASGDKVSAIVVRKDKDGKQSFKVEYGSVSADTNKGAKPLSKADVVSVCDTVVSTSKKQKAYIKAVSEHITNVGKIKVIEEASPEFLAEYKKATALVISTSLKAAFSSSNACRNVLTAIAFSAKSYEKEAPKSGDEK